MRLFLFICLIFMALRGNAQIVYGNTFNGIYSIDLGACTSTQLVTCPPFQDICISPSGLFYALQGWNITSINATTGLITTVVPNATTATATSLEWGIDDKLYALGNKLWQCDPVAGTSITVGSLPAGWNAQGDLVYLNGNYYATINASPSNLLAQINMTNPSASTIVGILPVANIQLVAGAAVEHPTCPKLYWFKWPNPSTVWEYDLVSATWSQKCGVFPVGMYGADSQNGYTFPLVCAACSVNAGNVTAQTFNLCGTSATATVPFTGGAALAGGSNILRYVLLSSNTNPAANVIAQSATPSFSFNPATMSTGVTYYLGTVVGPNLNGNVDLTASCIDFSNAFAQVTWRALPSLTLTTPNGDVCEGNCLTINAVWTGTGPFTAQVVAGAGAPQTITAAAGNTGTYQVCPPVGTLAGPVTLTTLQVTDVFCTCN
jgi:hypothetical protein